MCVSAAGELQEKVYHEASVVLTAQTLVRQYQVSSCVPRQMEKTVECTLSGRMSSLGIAEENADSRVQPTTGQSDYGPLLLFFEGSSSKQDKLRFVKYKGQIGVELVGMDLRVPVLAAAVECSKWQEHAFSRLRGLLLGQRQLALSQDWASERRVGTRLTASVRFGTYFVIDVPLDLRQQQSIAELEHCVNGRKKNVQLDRTNARSSSRSSWNVGPAASDRPGAEFKKSNPTLFKQVRQSLIPHVRGSMEKLRIKMHEEGFRRLGLSSDIYQLTILVPNNKNSKIYEYQVKVNSGLEFISLEKSPPKLWLRATLVSGEREESEAHERISSDAHTSVEQPRPNCVRYAVKIEELIQEGMLRDRLEQQPILEFAPGQEPGGCIMRVSDEYLRMVKFVRNEREEKWVSKDGLIVKLQDSMEWEGWSVGQNLINGQKVRQEVEVTMRDADAHLLGSLVAAEEFITQFWNTGLRFKEFLL
ncbi:hypothetical protein AXG93_4129s1130 [Marchantia polymorpha subsp. ruderalis]|uniref:Uncharacterized protein n=1 Tax=Marchantia polymorpha subsp. ruderalis TaxID=1480154 RepID=A0A176VFC6_MARPO|nr:hypothetical protein AXG93_4129s1130 [Marchantia polymorpha subsp. ruderalis]